MSSQPAKIQGSGQVVTGMLGTFPELLDWGQDRQESEGGNWTPSLRPLLYIMDEAGGTPSPREPLTSPSACLPPEKDWKGLLGQVLGY